MFNKREMERLETEIQNGEHKEIVKPLNLLHQANESKNMETLMMAKMELNQVILELDEEEEKSWRRELMLNYFLNTELSLYKNQDPAYTKWEVFLKKIEIHQWDVIENFVNKIDQYMSTQKDKDSNAHILTEEKMKEINKEYNKEILPYIEENLDYIDKYRAELRLKQRINLVKRKIPLNSNISLGEWIKEKRTAKNLPLSKLAEKSGYSTTYIFRIEKGMRKNPTPQAVSKIIEALGYSPDDYMSLFYKEDSKGDSSKQQDLELTTIIDSSDCKINGVKVEDEQKSFLTEILTLINEDDVLQVPKVNNLKNAIRNYQDAIK